MALLAASSGVTAESWERFPSAPDPEGFAGSFAGVSHGALLVAGGTNFPGKKPWEGGRKVWYDTVFVLERPDAAWKIAGHLPHPLAYGVSASWRDRVILAGGSDRGRYYAEALTLEWNEGKLRLGQLTPLPEPVANCAGGSAGSKVYVVAGQRAPDSTSALTSAFSLDLTAYEPRWRRLDDLPGPGRILPVAGFPKGEVVVAGGAELVPGPDGAAQRRYLRDAYAYRSGTGWSRLPDLPTASVAAPSPAPTQGERMLILGGDDGSQVLTPPTAHPGFSRTILFRDPGTSWSPAGTTPAPRVTVPCVYWRGRWVIPGGEARPGVRSPEVWGWRP